MSAPICQTCNYVNICIEQRGFCTYYRNRDNALANARRELEYAMQFKSESINLTKPKAEADKANENKPPQTISEGRTGAEIHLDSDAEN